jgi:hypothetical protein
MAEEGKHDATVTLNSPKFPISFVKNAFSFVRGGILTNTHKK